MYHQAADAMSRLLEERPIAENQVEDDIHTLDLQRNDKDDLPVVCGVILVELPMKSEAELLESKECDTYC